MRFVIGECWRRRAGKLIHKPLKPGNAFLSPTLRQTYSKNPQSYTLKSESQKLKASEFQEGSEAAVAVRPLQHSPTLASMG